MTINIKKFSPKVIAKLNYYVYLYSDPNTGNPFYIGKGYGNRVFNHLKVNMRIPKKELNEKERIIREILEQGKEPKIEILIHGIDEETALKVEASTIDLIGIENLANIQRGHNSITHGKIEAMTLEAQYNNEPLLLKNIQHKIIMIRINQFYHHNMTPLALYEATRAYWKVNINRAQHIELAFAVYDGFVIEVYQIQAWFDSLSTFMSTRDVNMYDETNRKEFVGKIADKNIRDQYINKSVSHLFENGNQNPIKYFD